LRPFLFLAAIRINPKNIQNNRKEIAMDKNVSLLLSPSVRAIYLTVALRRAFDEEIGFATTSRQLQEGLQSITAKAHYANLEVLVKLNLGPGTTICMRGNPENVNYPLLEWIDRQIAAQFGDQVHLGSGPGDKESVEVKASASDKLRFISHRLTCAVHEMTVLIRLRQD
jgi:hypothetical protein